MNSSRLSVVVVLTLASAALATLFGCGSPKDAKAAAPAERIAQVRTVSKVRSEERTSELQSH